MNFIINRKTLISMLFIALTMLGYISYRSLPFELMPNVEQPFFMVNVSCRTEVEPAYLEKNAVIPLEGAIGALENVESIESSINRRQGSILVNYEQKVNPKYALLKLQEKIESASSSLPDEFTVSVTSNTTSENYQLMDLLAIGSGDINRLRNVAEREIVTKLENIDGVSSVELYGGRTKSVIITIDEENCKAHNITTSQISSALRSQNLEKTFVGRVYRQDMRYFVNVEAEIDNLEDLKNIPIGNSGIKLQNIADVYFGYEEETQKSRVNGKESVSITLQRDPQSNMLDVSRKTLEVIEELNQKLKPSDVEILVQNNSAESMEKNLDLIVRLSIVGGLLAMLVLWMFLKNVRLILVIGLAIPISVYTAFNLFYAFDISLNNLTMMGIILAIGMLLDNSVVVLENIYGLTAKGYSTKDAVLQGTKDIMRPVIASTLTSVAVFVPFYYTSIFLLKVIGSNVGISIIATLLISLLVSLTLVPMITHKILQKYPKNHFQDVTIRNIMISRYVVLLKAAMRRPALTIFGSLVVFFIILLVSITKSAVSTGEVELQTMNLYVTMPTGSTLEQTDDVVAKIEESIISMEEQEEVSSLIREDEATLTIQLVEDYERKFKKSFARIKEEMLNNIGTINNVTLSFSGSSGGGGGGGGMGSMGSMGGSGATRMLSFLGLGGQEEKVVVKGEDFELMLSLANNIKSMMDEMTDISSSRVSVRSNQPQVELYFEKPLIAQYEIQLNNVLSELNSFSPQMSTGASLTYDNEDYDIIMMTESDTVEQRDKNLNDLRVLPVQGGQNANFELQEISSLVKTEGLSQIYRINGEKQIDINYSFVSDVNETKSLLVVAREDIDNLIKTLNMPSGIAVEVVHEENQFAQMKGLIYIALILIYMILASIFESFYAPFVIMFTIVLAIMGSLIAVSITGNSLTNMNVIMGFLILVGIVVNNGIILIDYINLLKKRGYGEYRAIITAGISRVRPILITAITTIIAMFPLAMGKSEYIGSIGSPFAITVIGGLTFSTLLTLIYVPTMYVSMRNSLLWISGLKWKTQVVMGILAVFATYLNFRYVERPIFQIIVELAIVIVIPGMIYLVLNSLRIANSSILDEE